MHVCAHSTACTPVHTGPCAEHDLQVRVHPHMMSTHAKGAMNIQTQAWAHTHTDTSMSSNRDKYPCTCTHLGTVQAHMLHRTAHIDLHIRGHPGLLRQEHSAATISDVGGHTQACNQAGVCVSVHKSVLHRRRHMRPHTVLVDLCVPGSIQNHANCRLLLSPTKPCQLPACLCPHSGPMAST